MKNGYNNTAIADVTFIAKIEDETIKKGFSDSDGKIELGPFAARDIVTVKVEKEGYDSWNRTIDMQTSLMQTTQLQVTLNPTVCSIFYVIFTALEYSVGSY